MRKRSYKNLTTKQRLLRDVYIYVDTGCWIWQGALSDDGYGSFYMAGMPERAHRAAHLVFKGELQDDLLACHTCDTPRCINPAHLWQGTSADNSTDRNKKGRARGGINGGRLPQKLTWEQVCVIRRSAKSGTSLARKYSVTRSLISAIVNNRARTNPPKRTLLMRKNNVY